MNYSSALHAGQVCVCVCDCMHACALVFHCTNSKLHRNLTCSNKALCGKTEKPENTESTEQKTASMPENLSLRPRNGTKCLMNRTQSCVKSSSSLEEKCQHRPRLMIRARDEMTKGNIGLSLWVSEWEGFRTAAVCMQRHKGCVSHCRGAKSSVCALTSQVGTVA